MKIRFYTQSWPIRGSFTISRGSRTQADVVIVELEKRGVVGRGECVPYSRYGESVTSVLSQLEALVPLLEAGLDRFSIQEILPAGAARNAVDCALWDLECKAAGVSIWQRLRRYPPQPLVSAYTLSLDSPDMMEQAARENVQFPILKLKMGGEGDLERVAAVRRGAPTAKIILDANESWTPELYQELVPELVKLNVAMIEQPLPAGDDEVLAELPHPIPLCADESCHDRKSLPALRGRYEMVNIKMDKTGGLTEALSLKYEARKEGFQVMVGCMLATSLAMAPAFVVAQGAQVVDLDGPLLLDKDRENGFKFIQQAMQPFRPQLWG